MVLFIFYSETIDADTIDHGEVGARDIKGIGHIVVNGWWSHPTHFEWCTGYMFDR